MSRFQWRNVTAIPIVHGRLPFAIEVRRQLLEHRFDALAVELPPSLGPAVQEAITRLPKVNVVLYRERPDFLTSEPRHLWYVPVDPCDAIIEALRVASGERTVVHFVDAETPEFSPRPLLLPDAHAIFGLGLEKWYEAILPEVRSQVRTPQDAVRERHMAARITAIAHELGDQRRLLFVCGLGHWEGIKRHLEGHGGNLSTDVGPDPALVELRPVHPRSLAHALGESPFLTQRFEEWRSGTSAGPFDSIKVVQDALLVAREVHREDPSTLFEQAGPPELANLLRYARKLTLHSRRLFPSVFSLAVAARGCIGNDFAVALLNVLNHYPANDDPGPESIEMTDSEGSFDGEAAELSARTPGEARTMGQLKLRRRPLPEEARRWRLDFDGHSQCSWPPEDVALENFRDFVMKRALGLAGLGIVRTEPFRTSFLDGLAMRETLRNWHKAEVHVKEEPRIVGRVGSLVLIFEEDADGTKFPWRTTWQAEKSWESTLAFYATDPRADMVGPKIGRMRFGGAWFLYPPLPVPDIWDDLRFERARLPSERLLLAAIAWTPERFIAYVAATPPRLAVKQAAAEFGKHILYVPLSSFSPKTLERLRVAHVLGGKEVRTWAGDYL